MGNQKVSLGSPKLRTKEIKTEEPRGPVALGSPKLRTTEISPGSIKVRRRGYTRTDGTRVKKTTFETPDKGKPGRTPKKDRWFQPTVDMNWGKDMPLWERRENALAAHGGDLLAVARALQALVNVTTDKETKIEARKDAKYFFREYKRSKEEQNG